jgi:dolichol-phosphate mannosyltransferase
MDLSIIIPFYNERDNVELLTAGLIPVVRELRRDRSVELVFVDDGSTDGTADLLRQSFGDDAPARIVCHERNRGLGAALRTGIAAAQGQVIVCSDSDSTYSYSLIPRLLELLTPEVDIVTGSCYHPRGAVENVPAYRVLLSKTASFMYRVILRWDIHTYTCMFRAYRRHVLDTVTFDSDDFLSVTELLANSIRRGYTVRELPCTLRVRRYGQSKAKILRIVRSHLRFQLSLLRHRTPPHATRTTAAQIAPTDGL